MTEGQEASQTIDRMVYLLCIVNSYGVIVIGAEDAVSSERGAITINYTTRDTCLIREPAREC